MRQLTYTSLLLIITLRLSCGERKICSTIKKSHNTMNMIVDTLLRLVLYLTSQNNHLMCLLRIFQVINLVWCSIFWLIGSNFMQEKALQLEASLTSLVSSRKSHQRYSSFDTTYQFFPEYVLKECFCLKFWSKTEIYFLAHYRGNFKQNILPVLQSKECLKYIFLLTVLVKHFTRNTLKYSVCRISIKFSKLWKCKKWPLAGESINDYSSRSTQFLKLFSRVGVWVILK